jgi:hypothetical protein
MDKRDKERLAIYESDKLSNDEKIELLIYKESKDDDLTDGERNANKVYIDAFKKVSDEFYDEIKEIKDYIDKEEYDKAESCISKAQTKLKNIEDKVKETPSTLTATGVAQCSTLLRNVLSSYTLKSAVNKFLGNEKRMVTKAADTFVKHADLDDNEHDKAQKAINSYLKQKKLYLGNVNLDMLKSGYEEIRGFKPVDDVNKYKDRALNLIKKEQYILDKLESRIKFMTK